MAPLPSRWRHAWLSILVLLLALMASCKLEATPWPPDSPPLLPSTVSKIPTAVATPAIQSAPAVAPVLTPATGSPASEITPVPPPEVEEKVDMKEDSAGTRPAVEGRRPSYGVSKPFAELVRPHFFAFTEEGNPVEARGEPDLLVEVDRKARVRLLDEAGAYSYLDPLALESERIGEHPVHKIYRLMDMGVPIEAGLLGLLENGEAGGLFTTIDFEYQRRQFSSGVVVEVFLDGTFLVLPDETPREWQGNDERIASPTHLHVNARALSGGSTPLAREYELEILSLPFEEQRYPSAPLALKQCRVYEESRVASDYAAVLNETGFRFTPSHIEGYVKNGANFVDRVQDLLYEGSGPGVRYFGFEGWWIAGVLKAEGVPWLSDCDTAGGFRAYPGGNDDTRQYLTVRRSLEPDKRQRYRILEVDAAGEATELYTAPGIILMALPLTYDSRSWLFSTEGWTPAEGDRPADPRWQAVYQVNLVAPDEYAKVRYPIDEFPRAPESGLYGASARMNNQGDFLFNTLYGFKDEGGGIWVVDVRDNSFLSSEASFARLVSWDHTLSWMPLGRLENDPSAMHLFMTGKEVAEDFAMTANVLRVREDGLNSAVEMSERLLQMVGWNPVPFGWQKLSDTEYLVLVETHYNYESSLMPRAKGVYIIPVTLP